MQQTIDIVIPWVDGNDPVLNAKRARYMDETESFRTDVGGKTRFADLGEIHLCIRSINKFAPFIHKIFIITDGQDPHVESRIPVEVVDHKMIFRDCPQYLPVFNSTAIETLIWNIPQLSEHFLLLNDDFILLKPVQPADFFTDDGRVVCYGQYRSAPWAQIMYLLSVLKYGYRRATFKKALMKGCRMGGMVRRFIYLAHTPRPLLKSVFEEYYQAHPEDISENMKHRFRNPDRYQVQALHYALLSRRKKLVMKYYQKSALFIRHWKGVDYLDKKISNAEASASCKFACFNSLDQASIEERDLVVSRMEKLLA